MSFILDALKKSETDRQQKGSAEFAGVPTSTDRQRTPRWLWVLGVLLAINLIVLLGLMFRPDSPTAASPSSTPVAIESSTASDEAFAEQVAEAKQNIPPREEPRTVAARTPLPATPSPSVTTARSVSETAALPTIHEVVADGTVTLPEMHVDIHVFSESPGDRFVFINMNKQTEGSRLAEGPIVEEITPDGVVLNHNGTSFLLPRD